MIDKHCFVPNNKNLTGNKNTNNRPLGANNNSRQKRTNTKEAEQCNLGILTSLNNLNNRLCFFALLGDPELQYQLGKLYALNFYRRDATWMSCCWLQISAEEGFPGEEQDFDTAMKLAMYEHGIKELEKGHFKEAFKYLKKSAEEGYAVSQFKVGEMLYSGGEGVKQDYLKAAEWFAKADMQEIAGAKIKLTQSQYKAGVMFYKGEDVEQDLENALEWIQKAADSGHAKALSKIEKIRDLYFLEKDAQLGYLDAVLSFAKACQGQTGFPLNAKKAIEYYEKAAARRSVEAEFQLSVIYGEGKIVKRDSEKAFEWFEKSLDHQHPGAQEMLIAMYSNEDLEDSPSLDSSSVDSSSDDSSSDDSSSVDSNDKQEDLRRRKFLQQMAFKVIEQAATEGDPVSMFVLGDMYENGIVVPQNKKKAFDYYNQAADLGNLSAKDNLKNMLSTSTIDDAIDCFKAGDRSKEAWAIYDALEEEGKLTKEGKEEFENACIEYLGESKLILVKDDYDGGGH